MQKHVLNAAHAEEQTCATSGRREAILRNCGRYAMANCARNRPSRTALLSRRVPHCRGRVQIVVAYMRIRDKKHPLILCVPAMFLPAALTCAAQCRTKQLCESLRHFTALRRTLFLIIYLTWDLTVAIADDVCDIS